MRGAIENQNSGNRNEALAITDAIVSMNNTQNQGDEGVDSLVTAALISELKACTQQEPGSGQSSPSIRTGLENMNLRADNIQEHKSDQSLPSPQHSPSPV